jgi:coenzyme F420 hydrogenase subunit beta
MRPNITELVVDLNNCIGCGVCSAVCPKDVLPMAFNDNGIYQPFEIEGCLEKCTLCIDACPFVKTNPTTNKIATDLYGENDNIKYNKDLGYFLDTYVAYKQVESERLKSPSGGAGNWLLTEFLKKGFVDKVITVESKKDTNKLFSFSVFSDVSELKDTRGSIYYPTEISGVLNYIKDNPGSYAITALPCYANAIRLAQNKNRKLRKRIKYIVGLVCGQTKSKFFTEMLGRLSGVPIVRDVDYRVKDPLKNANNFTFEFKGDKKIGRLHRNDQPNDLWGSRMFTPNACNSCMDTFSETADIVIMDAWLPEYSKDYRGHSLLLVRNAELRDIIKNNTRDLCIERIDYLKVLESQKKVVKNKKSVVLGVKNPISKLILKKRFRIQQLSTSSNWMENIKEIRSLVLDLKKFNKLFWYISLPKKLVTKVFIKAKSFLCK